ncbi:MAG: SDR family oxidoreductase [Capsulimonadaceae bacterium]
MLADKVALITGGGRGIGAAISRRLASEGATVVIHYHTGDAPAEALVTEIGGSAVALSADLRDPAAAAGVVDECVSRFGRIDILVNNAASFSHGRRFEQCAWSDFADEFEGVVGVVVNPSRAAVPHMRRQGFGRIVNTGATLLQRPVVDQIVHTTAKSALVGFTRTLARELGASGITVNMVSPGVTLTDFSQSLPDSVKDSIAARTPLRRLATPDDVAKVVLFFCSPLADFVTGANIAPDGGLAVL